MAGIIYEPVRDELFWEEKNVGAFLNRRRIRVSGRRVLGESLIATGIPSSDRSDPKSFIPLLKTVMAKTSGVRRLGSAALDLAYVAAGRYEGYWEVGLSPWDVAAGIIIVREAGGMVSEVDGQANMLYGNSILATNQQLYDPIRRLLMQAIEEENLNFDE